MTSCCVTGGEGLREQAEAWAARHVLGPAAIPVTFTYGGVPARELLPGWKRSERVHPLDALRTRHEIEWADADGTLSVRVEAVTYAGFPAVEWTGYLRNAGACPIPLIEGLRGCDLDLGVRGHDTWLHTIRGDDDTADSYRPLTYPLASAALSFAPVKGRCPDTAWPCFNLDLGGQKLCLALGWPGQWQADFVRQGRVLSVRGGQQRTRLRLAPGEEIRTPLTAVLLYAGDWLDGQNQWRRWMLAHNVPRRGGLPGAMTAVCCGLRLSEAQQMQCVEACLRGGARYDYRWVDAGWYENNGDWYQAPGVGTWQPDARLYPRGMRPFADFVHERGMKLVLWFEPERVCEGSWVWEHHPEWLPAWDPADRCRMLNLGLPAARQWITSTVGDAIAAWGVDLYRQDCNLPPLAAWRSGDAPEREGMTENLYVQGYLACMDALRARHPDVPFDCCASGGRRNDLETLRRALPLLRSDFHGHEKQPLPPDMESGNQNHTYGLSLWLPYHGSGAACTDRYFSRSHLCPVLSIGTDLAKPAWDELKARMAEYREIADLFLGDYYPLTPYAAGQDAWVAWEFVRPGHGDGFVQAFRRPRSTQATLIVTLRGLDPAGAYRFTDLDTRRAFVLPGAQLMEKGLPLTLSAPRDTLLLRFAAEAAPRPQPVPPD